MTHPKVTIIILNWNGKEDTIECLESLKHITYPNYKILLVDNGSTDGSVECFRERYPGMEIIENGDNLGFAEGNNVGIRRAMEEEIDYLLLLNNDTIVDPEFLNELINIAKNDDNIGMLGPKTYHYSDYSMVQTFTKKFNLCTGNFTLIPRLIKDNGGDVNEEVDSISGCCMLVTSKVIENVGILDPDYFLYWEETDWCYRIRSSGFKIVYVPEAKIWHKIGTSSGSCLSFYYFSRNLFLFMKKNATFVQMASFLIFFIGVEFWIHSLVLVVHHKNIPAFKSFLKGVKDGIKILYK